MYRLSSHAPEMTSGKCPECGSDSLLTSRGMVSCRNCGYVIGKTFTPFGAKKNTSNDKHHDSRFEASLADDLETRKRAGDIKDYEKQYRIIAQAFTADGELAFEVRHRVDFRVHLNDGSYELLEAKGRETIDYMWRRKCLETLWLPLHKDHTYRIVKQNMKMWESNKKSKGAIQ